jgi:hypothetical protein
MEAGVEAQMQNACHRVGEVGAAAFVLKATQLGLHVAKPLSDKESYNYIVHSGRDFDRVQVKTTVDRNENRFATCDLNFKRIGK